MGTKKHNCFRDDEDSQWPSRSLAELAFEHKSAEEILRQACWHALKAAERDGDEDMAGVIHGFLTALNL